MTLGQSGPPVGGILVLCEGNHCRAPMAEALLRAALPAGMRVESAGISAREGSPADAEAQRLMAAVGLDISGHRGRQVTPELALAADLILVMDPIQKAWCEDMLPSAHGRVFLLGHWSGPDLREIADPFNRGAEAFQEAFEGIQTCVADWVPHLTERR